MPLSEEELRLLEQMERALVEEDPKFASTLRGTTLRRPRGAARSSPGLAFAVGVAVLMAGAVASCWYVGIIGFVLMLGSATVALSALRGRGRPAGEPAPHRAQPPVRVHRHRRWPRRQAAPPAPPRQRSFMDRMEERWRRRRDTGGF